MQVPTTIDGLRTTLRALGFGDIVTGLENTAPNDAKQVLLDQLDFTFEESQQTLQDRFRHRKARSLVERFIWPALSASTAIASVIEALRELRALLRHDIPAPEGAELEIMEVEVEDEDEDGLPTSVRVTEDSEDDDCGGCSCDERGCGGSCSDCGCA